MPQTDQQKNKPWICEMTIELAEKKRRARSTGNKEEYKQLKAQVKQQVNADRKEWMETECGRIQEFEER